MKPIGPSAFFPRSRASPRIRFNGAIFPPLSSCLEKSMSCRPYSICRMWCSFPGWIPNRRKRPYLRRRPFSDDA